MYVYHMCVPGVHWDQKRGLDPLELSYKWLWAAIWVLGAESQSSAEAPSAVNHRTIQSWGRVCLPMDLTIHRNIAKCGSLDCNPTTSIQLWWGGGANHLHRQPCSWIQMIFCFFNVWYISALIYILLQIFSVDDKSLLEFCYLENVKCSFYSELFCCVEFYHFIIFPYSLPNSPCFQWVSALQSQYFL